MVRNVIGDAALWLTIGYCGLWAIVEPRLPAPPLPMRGRHRIDNLVAHTGIFTAGARETAAEVRRKALGNLDPIGIVLDESRNNEHAGGIRQISTDDSPTCVLVVPTNEELEIARQTAQAIA